MITSTMPLALSGKIPAAISWKVGYIYRKQSVVVAGYAHDSQQTIWAQRWEGFRQHGYNWVSTVVVKLLSCVQLFASPWTVACQALLSMDFPRQAYWKALPCPPPGDLLGAGIKPGSVAWQADPFPTEPPGKPQLALMLFKKKKKHGNCVIGFNNSALQLNLMTWDGFNMHILIT